MTASLIVPVDGSDASWTAFDVARSLAPALDATVRVVEVVFSPVDTSSAQARLRDDLSRPVGSNDGIEVEVLLTAETVAAALEELVEREAGSTIVMSSHGRGRAAGIVGSVADDVLQRTFGPVIIVGPEVELLSARGPVVIPVDGSEESESVLSLGASWAIELGVAPWIVNVSEEAGSPKGVDVLDSVYPNRLARELSARTGHPVEFEQLHGKNPARAVCDFADRSGASLIVASTHGRSGLRRVALGSVSADIIRQATCPVLVTRPPHRVE